MKRVECLSTLDCVRLSDLDTQINYLGCLLTCDKSTVGLAWLFFELILYRFSLSVEVASV